MRLTGARLIFYTFCTFCLSLVWGLRGTAQAQIQQILEIPANNQIVSGILPISGWAFSAASTDPVTVRLFIDGTDRGIIPCCVAREDVAAIHGDQALNSGFGLAFNFGLLEGEGEGDDEDNLSDGIHTIRIEIEDAAGNTAAQEHTVTVVRPGGFEFMTTPSLIGLSVSTAIEGQEIEILNIDVTGTDPDAQLARVNLRLAWQPNIQQLTVVEAKTLARLDPFDNESDDESDDPLSQPDDGGPITAVLENPPERTVAVLVTAGGIGTVSGWAFPKNPDATITQVTLRVDGAAPTNIGENIPCCSERTDVSVVFPQAPPGTGFGALVNFNRIESGQRTIGVEIRDSADPANSRIFDHTVSVVRLGNAEVLDLFELTAEETEESLATSVRLTGNLLTLENVTIRAKGSDESTQIVAGFRWEESCQCFVPFPLCGNGSRDIGEECDMTGFGGLTCETLGFGGGDLICNEPCGIITTECEEGTQSVVAVYVTTTADDAVSVINTGTNEVTQVIPVGDRPRGIAVSPDGTEAYVVNSGDNNVSVIDTVQKTVVATIPVGDEPQGVAFGADGTKAYVVNVDDNNVSVLNTATRTQETTIAVGRQPQSIAVTPDGLWAYVTNFGDDNVTVINLTTNTPLPDPIVVGQGPVGVAVSPDGTRVYVTNFGDLEPEDVEDNANTLSIIDTATNTVLDSDPEEEGVQPLQVGVQPVGVAFLPDSALEIVKNGAPDAYVTNFLDATVSVITDDAADPNAPSFNVAFNPRFNAVNNEPYGIAITPNGLRGYIALFGSRSDEGEVVQVFSTLRRAIVTTIEVGDKPFGVAIAPQ